MTQRMTDDRLVALVTIGRTPGIGGGVVQELADALLFERMMLKSFIEPASQFLKVEPGALVATAEILTEAQNL